MKSPSIVSLAVLLLVVFSAAMMVMKRPSPGASDADTNHPSPAVPEVDLLAHLEALAEGNQELRDRLSALELIPAAPARTPAAGYVTDEEFQAFREEVLAALDALAPGGAAKPAKLDEQVADALGEIRRQEAYAQAYANHEKSTSSVDGRVQGWSRWLGLDDVQQGQLNDLINERDEREREYLHAWKEGADEAALEEMRSSMHRDHFQSVRQILTPDQAATMSQKFGDGEDDEG